MKRLLIVSTINSVLAVLLFLLIAGGVLVPFNPSALQARRIRLDRARYSFNPSLIYRSTRP